MRNVLDKLRTKCEEQAKQMLRDIYTAPSRTVALELKELFLFKMSSRWRSARESHLVQNTAHASVAFMSCALASLNACVLCNRYCNQAVMELCNSMHLVDKNLEIVPYFRLIEG